jgi:hypothetical protein
MIISELRKLIRERKVIAVIGTGVSLGATGMDPRASWQGMVLDGVRRCEELGLVPTEWSDRRRGDVASGDLDELLGAAELVARKLGAPRGGDYTRFLRETAGSLRICDSALPSALCALHVPLATTNYDGILEEISGLEPVTWRDLARVQRILSGDEKAILHLHGHWRDQESVVFGVRSYEDVLRNEGAQAVLRQLPLQYSLLFVGCGDGLRDPNFGSLLAWMRKVLPDTERRHFRLVRASEEAVLRPLHPPEGRIFLQRYGAEYEDLVPFLRSLV